MPSNAGRPLRGLGFAQATVALEKMVGWCAARIRALGQCEATPTASKER
jgi:hypothetical protein